MVPEADSLARYFTGRVILLCVSLMASACSDDEPVKTTAACNCPPVVPQTQGNVYQRPVPAPVTAPNRMVMMPSRTFDAAPVQQGWGLQGHGTVPAEPAWGKTQQTYEAPRHTASQTQQKRAATPWTLPEQSPATVQQFQHIERPWGPPVKPAHGNQPRAAKGTSRQQPNPYQWGAPVGGGYYGWGARPYGFMPGAGYPGYAW